MIKIKKCQNKCKLKECAQTTITVITLNNIFFWICIVSYVHSAFSYPGNGLENDKVLGDRLRYCIWMSASTSCSTYIGSIKLWSCIVRRWPTDHLHWVQRYRKAFTQLIAQLESWQKFKLCALPLPFCILWLHPIIQYLEIYNYVTR